jgi:hypothetical protein
MWPSGEVIVARNVWYGRNRGASPGFVVEDSRERLVFWIPLGTPFDGPEPHGVPTEWELKRGKWVDAGRIVHHWGESWIATHVRPVARSAWWYVDVVDGVRRTASRLDYRDLLLDVAVDDGVRR